MIANKLEDACGITKYSRLTVAQIQLDLLGTDGENGFEAYPDILIIYKRLKPPSSLPCFGLYFETHNYGKYSGGLVPTRLVSAVPRNLVNKTPSLQREGALFARSIVGA